MTLHYITLPYLTLHYITLHYVTLHYITLHYLKRQERKASLRRRVVACAAVRLCARVGTLRDTRRPFFDLTTFARTPSVKHRMLEARWWSWSGNLSSFLWPNGLPDLHFEIQMEPKWCPEGPSETPWTHSGRFGGDLGAPRALRGCSRDLPGTLHGRSGTLRGHPGDPWERLF